MGVVIVMFFTRSISFNYFWVGPGLIDGQTIWDDYSIDSFCDLDLLYQVDQLVLARFGPPTKGIRSFVAYKHVSNERYQCM